MYEEVHRLGCPRKVAQILHDFGKDKRNATCWRRLQEFPAEQIFPALSARPTFYKGALDRGPIGSMEGQTTGNMVECYMRAAVSQPHVPLRFTTT